MKSEKFLKRAFEIVHDDIGGELYIEDDENLKDIDSKKIVKIINSFSEMIGNDDNFYVLNFLYNFNKGRDYSNLDIKDNLTLKDFNITGYDTRYIISQEFGIPYNALEPLDDYEREFCVEEGYDDDYEGCFVVNTEEHAKEILDEMFADSYYSEEDVIDSFGIDTYLKYCEISEGDKRQIVLDMVDNYISGFDDDEIVGELDNFGGNDEMVEEYNELNEKIEELEYEEKDNSFLIDELKTKREHLLVDITHRLEELYEGHFEEQLSDLKDYLWEYGYISKKKGGEFELEGELPSYVQFDFDEFVKNENWYGADMLSPYEEVYETYQFGQWFYIVKVEE